MKKHFYAGVAAACLAHPAVAADLPRRPPVLTSLAPSWDGFYVGLNFSTALGRTDWSNPTGALLLANTPRFPANGDSAGMLGGVTFGYNHQIGSAVVGVEADVNGASLIGDAACGGVYGFGGAGWRCESRTDALSSLSARAGIAIDRTLLFGKIGVAYARSHAEITTFAFPAATVSTTENRFGLALGAGVEYAIDAHWSAKTEFDYYGFQRAAFSGFDANYGAVYGASRRDQIFLAKAGLNYRFGGAERAASEPFALANDITGEFGARLGYTTGKFAFNLYDPFTAAQMNSRLTWPEQQGVAGEAISRFDHVSGVFFKTMTGGAVYSGGHMTDEDFPPAVAPYSNTRSSTKDGHSVYGTVDIGVNLLQGPQYRLGALIGWSYLEERMRASGCTQTATSGICQPAGLIPASQVGLSRNETWNAVRLGVGGQVMVTDRIKLAGEAAWLPYAHFSGADNHWLRPDINPLSDTGNGHNGYQLEGIASYKVTSNVELGVGARYWSLQAKGHTQFPFLPASPTTYKTDRTTVFLQASYAFGGATPKQPGE